MSEQEFGSLRIITNLESSLRMSLYACSRGAYASFIRLRVDHLEEVQRVIETCRSEGLSNFVYIITTIIRRYRA